MRKAWLNEADKLCMVACTCMCLFACVHESMCVCLCMCEWVSEWVSVCVCACVRACVRVCVLNKPNKLCMLACMYMCLCLCVHAHACVCDVCMCVRISECVSVCVCACVCVCVCISVCACGRMCVFVYVWSDYFNFWNFTLNPVFVYLHFLQSIDHLWLDGFIFCAASSTAHYTTKIQCNKGLIHNACGQLSVASFLELFFVLASCLASCHSHGLMNYLN